MFDWDDFLTLAKELAQSNDEASLRTAISRIYYAVYWKARIQLEKEGFVIMVGRGKGTHEQVWEEFDRRQGTTNKAIFRAGDELKRNRVKADYKAEVVMSKNLASDSFRLANNVLAYLKQVQPKAN
ncbi:MAG: hypothetical protein M3388_17605 [Acidobacteriota bacterium]|nr:hypothetical protein [Acidobacteriota bacterium]